MKGLRFTCIQSEGFNRQFSRCQLWEHDLVPLINRKPFWHRGRIIYHSQDRRETLEYFKHLLPDYQDGAVEFYGGEDDCL